MVAGFLIAGILFMATFAFLYVKYEGIVDRRMSGQIFTNAAKIYARPQIVQVGDKLNAAEVAAYLRRSGYSEQGKEAQSPVGQFRIAGGHIEVIRVKSPSMRPRTRPSTSKVGRSTRSHLPVVVCRSSGPTSLSRR